MQCKHIIYPLSFQKFFSLKTLPNFSSGTVKSASPILANIFRSQIFQFPARGNFAEVPDIPFLKMLKSPTASDIK